jgi:hypothetical protein
MHAICPRVPIDCCGGFHKPVPKTSINDLLQALESLRDLQETVGKHGEALTRMLDRLDSIDKRLEMVEKRTPP